MRKLVLTMLVVCFACFNQTVFADQLTSNADLSNLNVTEINNLIVLNKNVITELQQENKNARQELVNTEKQIQTLNDIVFFYSDKNITNVFEAVKNDVVEATPVLQFENTKCGYPIYNGAQAKLDKLIRLRTKIAQLIETNEATITSLQNKTSNLVLQKSLLIEKVS